MARLRRPQSFAAFLFLCSSSAALGSQPLAAQSTPSERETVRALMAEGDRLRASGDLRAALTRYQAAHAIVHAPTTGLDLARVQAQLGLLVEASSTASEVIHHPLVTNEPAVFAEARRQAVALANELESRVPSIKVEVHPASVTYSVSVDGVELPSQIGSLPYKVNPGQHSVYVVAPGYVTANRQVVLNDSETQSLSMQLISSPAVGALDKPAESAPLSAASQASYVQRDSGAEQRRDAAKLRGYIGLGVGGAALIAGAVSGGVALGLGSDVKEKCRHNLCDPSQRGQLSSANTLANVSNVTLSIGVLGIAYGLYELLTLPSAVTTPERAGVTHFEITGTGAVLRGSL